MQLPIMLKTKKRSEHYVSNKEFHNALIQYKKEVDTAKENGNPKPIIPNYIGECFIKKLLVL